MKKRVGVCVLLIIIFSSFMANLVYAADNNYFSMTNAKGKKGEEVTITISLDKALAFAAADFIVKYDSSKLEYVKYTEQNLLQEAAMSIANNNSDEGIVAIGYVSNPQNVLEKKKPSKMMTITFKIKSDVNETTNLVFECTSMKTQAGESIIVSDTNAIVTIEADSGTNYNNNNNNNNGSGGTNNGNKGTATQADAPLPYTGNNITKIIVALPIVIGFSAFLYKKCIEYREI